MTIREITALRKSGRLTEALEAAEAEYAQNANVYNAGALFWCLNDLYKTQEGDLMEETIARMQSLYYDHCEGNEYMQHSLASARRRILPHYSRMKEAIEKAKNGGDAIALHQSILNIYETGEIDRQLFADFGWLTYYALKATPVNDSYKRKILLNLYFNLELERPSILHSLILCEAIKVEQNTPLQFRIRDFVRIWGLENLREDDWTQFTTDAGNTLPSTVEKLIGVYAKELKTDGVEASEDFAELVDKALERFPLSQNMPYFKATVLLSQGLREEALKYYRQLILRFPSKFYHWHQASELVDDLDTKIGLLSKALSCGDDEGFLGSVRLRLASLLMQKGLAENAKTELEKYRTTYQSRGWNLKPEFWNLYNTIATIEPTSDNRQIYKDYSAYAEQFIYSELPSQTAVKVSEKQLDNRNHSGRRFTQWSLRTQSGILRLKKPAKYGLNPRTPNGAIFTIKTIDEKIVWIKQADGIPQVLWLKEVNGTIQIRTDRKGNNYAILQGVYVGEKLLQGVADGSTLKVLAILQDDGRWSAISKIR